MGSELAVTAQEGDLTVMLEIFIKMTLLVHGSPKKTREVREAKMGTVIVLLSECLVSPALSNL